MTSRHSDYKAIFWVHLIVNLALVFSWALFSWWIILLGSFLLQAQYYILGGCILSRMEFGRKEDCIVYYADKWGFVTNKKFARKFVETYLHIIVIAIGLIWQLALGFSPLIF